MAADSPKITDWISAAGSLLTFLGLVLVVWQVRMDHRRSRRERAVDVSKEWITVLAQRNQPMFQLALALEGHPNSSERHAQISRICDCLPFPIPQAQSCLFQEYLGASAFGGFTTSRGDRVLAVAIRAEAMTYLNYMEWIFSTWRHEVTERPLIEEQFADLTDERSGAFILQTFFECFGGGRCFPNLATFLEMQESSRHRSFPKQDGVVGPSTGNPGC